MNSAFVSCFQDAFDDIFFIPFGVEFVEIGVPGIFCNSPIHKSVLPQTDYFVRTNVL